MLRSAFQGAVLLFSLISAACDAPSEPRAPNVLLIVLDTTRADATSAHAERVGATPTLASLAREGVVFERARSTSAWTLPAHGSLFTGLYPSRHGAHHESHRLAPEMLTLAELLDETHRTGGFSENPHIGAANGFAQGFDHYRGTWRRRGKATGTERLAIEWLKETERASRRPFFLFVNLMDAHLPYRPPAHELERLVGPGVSRADLERLSRYREPEVRRHITGAAPIGAADLGILRRLYRAAVAHADLRAGRIIDYLRESRLLDETLVIVVSDHGENIGEHGLMEHQLCLYETLLRVPLVMRLPGVFDGGRRVAAPVQLVDVLPTVLDVTGVPRQRWPAVEGISLLDAEVSPERPIVAEYMRPTGQRKAFAKADPDFDFERLERRLRSLQRGRYKLVVSDRGERELYDLAADPAELSNLAEAETEVVARLASLLDDWVAARAAAPRQPEPKLDADTRESLRALGYIE